MRVIVFEEKNPLLQGSLPPSFFGGRGELNQWLRFKIATSREEAAIESIVVEDGIESDKELKAFERATRYLPK